MKGLPCPCPALPRFWQLGSRFMAEGSGTQAPGKGPLLSVQLLRAQYEGLRRQQRAQARVVVLPRGGNIPAPAESVVSAVWINKERRHSLSLEEADAEAEGMLEEADRGCLRTPESPWHTHLEMYRLVQTFHQETSHQVKHKEQFMGPEQTLPQEGDSGLSEDSQMTQQGIVTPEAAQHKGQVGNTQTEARGSGLKVGTQCPLSIKNPHRSGKPAHYPFPQRKTPRISQAARNLGLYGPSLKLSTQRSQP
uniref:Chromosome 9 open reading frame 152 n=1 Tax=Catagonus wagneri TaxID=51154 RepID=A0A8C3YQU5_9CETA